MSVIMPPKVKRVPKRGQPTTAAATSQKQQRLKGKKRDRDPVVESVEEGSGEEPNAEAIELSLSDCDTDIEPQGSDLEDRHQAKLGEEVAPKREMTRDLDLMFSKHLKVNFKKSNKATLMTGHWCLTFLSLALRGHTAISDLHSHGIVTHYHSPLIAFTHSLALSPPARYLHRTAEGIPQELQRERGRPESEAFAMATAGANANGRRSARAVGLTQTEITLRQDDKGETQKLD
ncbi:hypothetical protein EDB83DRAFT_2319521 [Lactarius deliciosus]|nr:hypothetical protein EDB83DRAFT_2319521 [Lactarius deliciosus]